MGSSRGWPTGRSAPLLDRLAASAEGASVRVPFCTSDFLDRSRALAAGLDEYERQVN